MPKFNGLLGQTRAYALMPQPETGKISCVHHLPCARLSLGVSRSMLRSAMLFRFQTIRGWKPCCGEGDRAIQILSGPLLRRPIHPSALLATANRRSA